MVRRRIQRFVASVCRVARRRRAARNEVSVSIILTFLYNASFRGRFYVNGLRPDIVELGIVRRCSVAVGEVLIRVTSGRVFRSRYVLHYIHLIAGRELSFFFKAIVVTFIISTRDASGRVLPGGSELFPTLNAERFSRGRVRSIILGIVGIIFRGGITTSFLAIVWHIPGVQRRLLEVVGSSQSGFFYIFRLFGARGSNTAANINGEEMYLPGAIEGAAAYDFRFSVGSLFKLWCEGGVGRLGSSSISILSFVCLPLLAQTSINFSTSSKVDRMLPTF